MKKPELEGMTTKERLNEFFSQYTQPTCRESYDDDGLMSYKTMQQAADLLLQAKVFETEREMKMEALRDFEVIIPEMIFHEY